MQVSRTVIISCAGMGNRLGLGTTKALVEVEGKPLIMHHLEKLKDEEGHSCSSWLSGRKGNQCS